MMLLGQKGKKTLGANFRNEDADFRETGCMLCRRVITTPVAKHLFVCGAEMLRFCADKVRLLTSFARHDLKSLCITFPSPS